MRRENLNDLARMHRAKQTRGAALAPLGEEMVAFFKTTVRQRQTKFSRIALSWSQLVPETFNEHCVLYAFTRGTLTVLVDSSVHLYELKQLLLSGLQDQLLIACQSGGLRKITLKPGRAKSG